MPDYCLIVHPQTPSCPIDAITAAVDWTLNGASIRFHVSGAIDDVVWPAAQSPVRADGLWKSTCFEAFVRTVSAPAYTEFNFSPAGAWAAYRFARYRDQMRPAQTSAAPKIACTREDARAHIDIKLADWGAELADAVCLHAALTVVLEAKTGARSYWALAHPPGAPDFHHLAGFAAVLERA